MLFLASPPADASDGAIEISQAGITAFPYVISTPGAYVLTSDLSVPTFGTPAIRVDVDDVSIDLNGFTVEFTLGTSGAIADGIEADLRDRITVRNGTVKGFNGTCVEANDSARVDDLHVEGCVREGVRVGEGSHVRRVIAIGNGTGIRAGLSSLVERSIARDNAGNGIAAAGMIIENVSTGNGGNGVEAQLGSSVRNNALVDNGGAGIFSTVLCFDASGRYFGYAGNTIRGNALTIVSGGCAIETGTNLCQTDTTCP